MLKYWVGLLVVLNAAGLAWQWGALATWGFAPPEHREPERLKQQLRPEALHPVPVPAATDRGAQPVAEATDASPPAPSSAPSSTPASASSNPSVAAEPMPLATPAAPALAPR
jgi:hypothetical protein